MSSKTKLKVNANIFAVPISSPIATMAIEDVLNESNDKRIAQKSLDLYRGEWEYTVDLVIGGIIFIVAIVNGRVVGMSAVATKDGIRTSNSVTVVDKRLRRLGIGSAMMTYKLRALKHLYPHISMVTRVAKDNLASVMTCKSAGLVEIGNGQGKAAKNRVVNYYRMGFKPDNVEESEEIPEDKKEKKKKKGKKKSVISPQNLVHETLMEAKASILSPPGTLGFHRDV